MDLKDRKQKRIDEVRRLLNAFCEQRLSPEHAQYVADLWERIGRKRNYVITTGKAEVWASAVIYVIARLNFLFDRSSPQYLPPDTICDFFGTKKSTVAARATHIESECRIRMGEEGLCSPHISDSLTFVQLPSGIVLPKKMAKEYGYCLKQ